MKGLNGFQLKLIAIVFMLLDHINTYFGRELHFPLWFSFLGRFVAPLFVFLLVEGFFHTKNRRKYLERLGIGAAVMMISNILHNIWTKAYLDPLTGGFSWWNLISGQNILLTLFLLFAFLWLLDSKQLGLKRYFFLLLLILPILMSEGGIYLLPILLICYFFYQQKQRICIGITIFSLLLLIQAVLSFTQTPDPVFTFYQHITFDNEFMMVGVVPFILLYNGLRGGSGSRFQQYFFYIFYPLHLWIIYLIQGLM